MVADWLKADSQDRVDDAARCLGKKGQEEKIEKNGEREKGENSYSVCGGLLTICSRNRSLISGSFSRAPFLERVLTPSRDE